MRSQGLSLYLGGTEGPCGDFGVPQTGQLQFRFQMILIIKLSYNFFVFNPLHIGRSRKRTKVQEDMC